METFTDDTKLPEYMRPSITRQSRSLSQPCNATTVRFSFAISGVLSAIAVYASRRRRTIL